MALNVGSRLGHYNVTALIGEGGMGQVYQATDTKLKRQVALKILPEAFSADPERLARFQREAEVLASLNHPNIAAIYGLEEADDTRALVLELVEGPTLADRIKRGPIPLDEALPIAKQIAEALEAAHEAGVIHRDLKPANIKVKDDGTVKVLDFGLAKALDPSPVGDPSQSPTLTAAATQMGVIMGTAAYMSPEQARGKPVDKRADIWAFGCVLYEMLTGRMAFHGEDVSLTLASVMKSDVNVKALSPDVPATVRTVLSRCLEKDTSQRIRDIGDVRLALAGAFETPAGVPAERPVVKRRAREWLPWVAGIAIGSLVAAVVLSTARESETSLPTRFTIQTPAGFEAFQPPVVSTDGRTVAFQATPLGAGPAETKVYLRSADQLEAIPLPDTRALRPLDFSPDGEWLLVTDQGVLKRVALDGSGMTTITEHQSIGADWGPDDTVVHGSDEGLFLVPAAAGEPRQLTTVAGDEAGHYSPTFLPNNRAVLFHIWDGSPDTSQVAVYDFGTDESSRNR